MHNRRSFAMLLLAVIPLLVSGQYFEPVWVSPFNPMTIYVTEAACNNGDLQPGDEIGIFDIDPNSSEEICVGAVTLTEVLGGGTYLELIASMGDGTGQDLANGFTPGNPFIFKYYVQGTGLVEEVEFTFPYPGYDEVFTSQGNTIIALSETTAPAEPFEPVWVSPYNPMTFYITRATVDGVDLEAGAQVGIFDIDATSGEEICVGAAYLTGVLSGGSFLEMIASMNDGTNPDQANGFTPGNPFIFKLITQDNQLVVQISYSFPYPGYDEEFTSQGNTIVDILGTTQQPQQQTINLVEGWAGISSYLVPQQTTMSAVLSELSGNCQIIQNLDAYFQPGERNGDLTNWDYTSGYFIKMSVSDQLLISGFEPALKSITLQEGWNLIPVLSEESVGIQTLFAGQFDKFILIRDAIGKNIYWPEKGITTLQNLETGKSYLVLVNEEFSIDFQSL